MSSNCCKVCKSMTPCGCKDTPLTIPVNYVTDPTVCPDPNPCSEIFDSQCICYSGDDLTCAGQTWEIPSGTSAQIVIQTLFNALCEVASSGTFNMLSPASLNDPTTWDLGDLLGNANVIRLNADSNGVKFTFDRVGCGDDITIRVTSSDLQFGPLFTATTSNSITVSSNQSDVTYEMGYSYSGEVFPVDVPITFTYESCGSTVVQNGFITLT